ncbi:hypothetical protein K0M31_005882, partial [Melipona bicolor]
KNGPAAPVFRGANAKEGIGSLGVASKPPRTGGQVSAARASFRNQLAVADLSGS